MQCIIFDTNYKLDLFLCGYPVASEIVTVVVARNVGGYAISAVLKLLFLHAYLKRNQFGCIGCGILHDTESARYTRRTVSSSAAWAGATARMAAEGMICVF